MVSGEVWGLVGGVYSEERRVEGMIVWDQCVWGVCLSISTSI